uniref:Uncharacterized protein n=1 Tax=Ascaris lumbricoides TaxID=6252 RepID=A0A0M3HY20_ASCLU
MRAGRQTQTRPDGQSLTDRSADGERQTHTDGQTDKRAGRHRKTDRHREKDRDRQRNRHKTDVKMRIGRQRGGETDQTQPDGQSLTDR